LIFFQIFILISSPKGDPSKGVPKSDALSRIFRHDFYYGFWYVITKILNQNPYQNALEFLAFIRALFQGVVAIAPQQSQTIPNNEKQKKMFIIVRYCSSLLKPQADFLPQIGV